MIKDNSNINQILRLSCIIFAALIFIISACSPVRTGYSGRPLRNLQREKESDTTSGKSKVKGKTLGDAKKISSKIEAKKGETTTDSATVRFSDTTVIVYQPVEQNSNSPMTELFDDAIKDFDAENYDQSCPKFSNLAETLIKGDSLYFEAVFYKCECEIINNNFDEAENILKTIYKDPKLPDNIMEKTLVRLGQIYCVLSKNKLAEEYFSKLKKNYPKSIYIPLANCKAVK